MLAEVYDGIVDTSVASFTPTQERLEFADFTQEMFGWENSPFIRRPSKRDLSFRYFWLGEEFTFQNIRSNA